ncbi:hypothetical protein JW978_02220 [Candidatus Dojkabacteria bacterium]|nr:hypothetical protein [Candidatus Dojkabacteria bacterium]
MFLDETALKIITKSMGFSPAEQEAFIANYYDVISRFLMSHIVGYIAEHEPDRMEEINKMFEAQNVEERVKGQKVILDQIKLFLASYDDLEQETRDVMKEYDNAIFFRFIGDGPKEDVFEIIDYLMEKIRQASEYPKIMKNLEKRFGKKTVDEFLSSEKDSPSAE